MITKRIKTILDNVAHYLHQTLGFEAMPVPWAQASQLPQFLRSRYHFFEARIENKNWLLVIDGENDGEPPVTVRKHIDNVETHWTGPVIFVRDWITADRRNRFIQRKVPFIVPGNQQYLPFIGVDFRERFRPQRPPKAPLTPAAQALLILILLKREPKIGLADAALQLGYTPMTISRAITELDSLELGQTQVSGRARQLQIIDSKREVWDRAQEFLRSPVARKETVSLAMLNEVFGLTAGMSALAKCSGLTDGPIPEVAVSGKRWKELSSNTEMKAAIPGEPDSLTVQVWRYDPRLFSTGSSIDRLSLFLSLREYGDERVQAALLEMTDQFPW